MFFITADRLTILPFTIEFFVDFEDFYFHLKRFMRHDSKNNYNRVQWDLKTGIQCMNNDILEYCKQIRVIPLLPNKKQILIDIILRPFCVVCMV